MSEAFRDLPPRPDQRVTELHAWIATHRSGAEGIIAVNFPGDGETSDVTMPLVGSQREELEKLGEVARRAVNIGRWAADPPVSARLVSFRRIEAPDA